MKHDLEQVLSQTERLHRSIVSADSSLQDLIIKDLEIQCRTLIKNLKKHKNLLDKRDTDFEKIIFDISVDVEDQLKYAHKNVEMDDYTFDMFHRNVMAVFDLNKLKYLKEMQDK